MEPKKHKTAEHILRSVKRVYQKIATEFAKSRDRSWPEFDMIIPILQEQTASNGLKLIDIGCGNGRLAALLPMETVSYLGIDNSEKILSEAQKRFPKSKHPHVKFQKGDVLHLPCKDCSFDAVCCIATLHHIPSRELQLKALQELRRIMREKGVCIVSVWNLHQKQYSKYKDEGKFFWVPWGKPKTSEKIVRYFYGFEAPELEELLKDAGFKRVTQIPNERNHIFIAKN